MHAIRAVWDRPGEQSSERKPWQDKEDRQNPRPNWVGALMAVVLLVVVGLFVFVHGCGKHDHDDELLLPMEGRPSAGP